MNASDGDALATIKVAVARAVAVPASGQRRIAR